MAGAAVGVTRTAVGSGVVLSLGAALVGPVAPAGAATFAVTNNNDAGAGSLRQAIRDANAAAGDDEITFAPGLGTIPVSTGQIVITDGVTITGPGQAALTIQGGSSRIFYVTTTDSVTISGLTVSGGLSASAGGSIRSNGADLTIQSSTIERGRSQATGGAIASVGGDLVIESSTIQDSRAPGGGGGVLASGGSLTVSDSVITGNNAINDGTVLGGGIATSGAAVSVTNTEFTGNTVGYKLYNPGTEYQIGLGGFYGYGGGLNVLSPSGPVTVSGSTFENNVASRGGGGVFVEGGGVTIDDAAVLGNTGGAFGGGIKLRGVTTTGVITGSTISDNSAHYGGGIDLRGGVALSISGSTISDNAAQIGGGMAARDIDDLTVDASAVAGNTAATGGGAHIVFAESSTIISSTISGNTGNTGLRLMFIESSTVTSSTISGNTGRGIAVVDYIGFPGAHGVTIAHSTIAGNGSGGLFLNNEPATLDHTIVGDNTADISGTGSVTLAHSLVESAAVGVTVTDAGGNLQGVDPGLLPLDDNGGPTFTHALAPGSAAFDAGDPGFAPPPATDQRGQPRESADAIDIGAFEEQVIPVVLPGGGGVLEGNSGTRVVNVKVRLSTASGFPVTVDWATFDSVDQPAEGIDYQSASGMVTFAPGEVLKTVPVTVLGDSTEEPDEFIPVQFTNPSGATIGGFGLGFGVIHDDDPVPTIQPGGGAVVEGDAGPRVVNVKVKLSNPSSLPITVDWATVDSVDQPAEGLDYESASGQVTFAPGEVLKIVPITILGDTTDEPDEFVPVHFTNPTNATIGGYGLGFGLIRDDD